MMLTCTRLIPRTHHFFAVAQSRSPLAGPRLGRIASRAMASRPSTQELQELPGVAKERDPATKQFVFQQTMFRVKDLKRSLDFYTRILGFTVLEKLDFKEAKFSLVFLGQCDPKEIPQDPADRVEWMFKRPGCLELTYNWGSEESSKEPYYYNGNDDSEKQGYGHIGSGSPVMIFCFLSVKTANFEVPDVEATCKRFEQLGVQFVKKPNDGRMKGLAFIKDPDNYWIEIFNGTASRLLVE